MHATSDCFAPAVVRNDEGTHQSARVAFPDWQGQVLAHDLCKKGCNLFVDLDPRSTVFVVRVAQYATAGEKGQFSTVKSASTYC